MLGEACEDFHKAALEGLLRLRDGIPGRHGSGPRSKLGVLWNPALGLGTCESTLAVLVPAVVELALILVCPFLHDLMRPVRGAGSPVHQKWLVRRVSLLFAEPFDRILGNVVGKVIALSLLFGDLGGVARQGR